MGLLDRLQEKKQSEQPETPVKENAQEEKPVEKSDEKPAEKAERIVEEKPPKLKELAIKHESAPKKQEKPVENKEAKELKNKLHNRVLEEMKGKDDIDEVIEKLDEIALEIIKENEQFKFNMDRRTIIADLKNDLTGFGPINPLLLDEDVSEVMVNGPDQVYCEKKGKIILSGVTFRDDEHVLNVIEKIVAPIGRRIDESSPMVDARLPDGSRVNAIIPPLALNGPTITIRKFATDPLTISDLVQFGTLTDEMAEFVDACVKARLNIFVSGGTGSGKTTTLNVLSSFIPNDERIVTIEDAAELQLGQDHVVRLESRPPNIEGQGAISIRDLVRNSLRMRPDRIVIGEVRGGEALDMLQAMNTGHDGSLATGHSNSPRDMIARLETMVLLAGVDLPVKAIREQIAGAIDVIIQQSRLKDGSRKIVKITEVQGLEGDVIVLQDIFTYEQRGKDTHGNIIGKLVPTGIRPKFYERLEHAGITISPDVFIPNEE
ncbi:CpaF family protein [Salisediminibacterium beveridgei]|uniref:Type II/IV secretion system ATP hydrolase TadA/VirB11/CpaF, TadA subfamily n=1 Tax=Salisediminibacterium beveridgei TaxID=632773 RepID=A0A1D7QXX5_9BACI|nr:CpaF family protein [Salisediminibacterium beveridgei]AOM83859.1 Type II/IV secretion system ATP hydrolase TadA/VirB11/CpaF, TadA subfamily [Salisediminibacterium beveridgei]